MENLTAKKTIIGGDDSIVVKKFIKGIEGGRTLNLTAWYKDMGDGTPVKCGHVILIDSSGNFIPWPVYRDKYKDLDLSKSGYRIAGVLYGTVTAPRQAASIMTQGVVNPYMVPYEITMLDEFDGTYLHITFETDSDILPEVEQSEPV